ncbi:MAG: CPBP family intramembrane metalloprotease [Planctomycetes bacterium]|nr:CPBP family intramembrane metalloprotease [Planctomycetota bacterium]
MNGRDDATGTPPPGRWRLGLGTAVALFVFARLRGELGAYVAMHRWLADHGVDEAVRQLDHALWIVAGAVLAARLAYGRGGVLRGLGLTRGIGRAAVFALAAGAPMLLQAAIGADGVHWNTAIAHGVLLAPLVEELFFRAVLVAIPVRCGSLPFWPVAIVAGVLFGSMHVPWNATFGAGHLGVLAATTAGGIWYGWLLRCFDWQLWPTILLHAVMNGAWAVFAAADDAAGGVWPNIGRGLTIAVGTVLALRQRRRQRAG